MEELSHRKRSRVDSAESDFDAKRIKEDLLSLLDDSDPAPDRDSVAVSHDLDSVIRSFEEEITGSVSRTSPKDLIDLTSESGEFLPEFGQVPGELPEENKSHYTHTHTHQISDKNELIRVASEWSGIGGFLDFPSELPGYDSFGLGVEYAQEQGSSEYVTLDGLFDYSDVNLGSEFLWRKDTLPAI